MLPSRQEQQCQIVGRPTPILEAKTRQILWEIKKSTRTLPQDSIERAFGLLLIARSADNILFRQVHAAVATTTKTASNANSIARRALDRWANTACNHPNPFSALQEKARTVSLENGRTIEKFLAAGRRRVNAGKCESLTAISAALLAEVRSRVADLEATRSAPSDSAVAEASAAISVTLAAAAAGDEEAAGLAAQSPPPRVLPALWSPATTLEYTARMPDGASARTFFLSNLSASSLSTSVGNTTADSGSGDSCGISSEDPSKDNDGEVTKSAARLVEDVPTAETEAGSPVMDAVVRDEDRVDGVEGLSIEHYIQNYTNTAPPQAEAPSRRSAKMTVDEATQTHRPPETVTIVQEMRELLLEGISQVTARQESMEARLVSQINHMQLELAQQNAQLMQMCKLGLGLRQNAAVSRTEQGGPVKDDVVAKPFTGKGAGEKTPKASEGSMLTLSPRGGASVPVSRGADGKPGSGQTVAVEGLEAAELAGDINKEAGQEEAAVSGAVGQREETRSKGVTPSVTPDLVVLDANVAEEISSTAGEAVVGGVDYEPAPLNTGTTAVIRTADWNEVAVRGGVGTSEEVEEAALGGTEERCTGGEDASRWLPDEGGLILGTAEDDGRPEEGGRSEDESTAVVVHIVAPSEDDAKEKTAEPVHEETVEPLAVVAMGAGITVLQLSAEERGMAGAPQGDIYQVTVLESLEFVASTNVRQDLQIINTAIEDLGGGTNPGWARVTAAVDSARRLLLHHFDAEFEGNVDQLGGLVTLAVAATGRLESHAARNGLRCVGDLFRSGGGDFLQFDDVRQLVEATVRHMVSDRAFMVREAKEAMEAAVAHADKRALLAAMIPLASNGNFKVAQEAVLYTSKCLQGMGPEDFEAESRVGGTVIDVGRLVQALANGLRLKSAVSKGAAKKGLTRCREIVGEEPLKRAVDATLTDSTVASEVRAVMAASKRGGDGKGFKASATRRKVPRGAQCAGGGRLAALIRASRANQAAAGGGDGKVTDASIVED